MTIPANPPPIKVPDKIEKDPELRGFFNDLLRSLYMIWARTGAGSGTVPPAGLPPGLEDIANLTPADNHFILGDGSHWTQEDFDDEVDDNHTVIDNAAHVADTAWNTHGDDAVGGGPYSVDGHLGINKTSPTYPLEIIGVDDDFGFFQIKLGSSEGGADKYAGIMMPNKQAVANVSLFLAQSSFSGNTIFWGGSALAHTGATMHRFLISSGPTSTTQTEFFNITASTVRVVGDNTKLYFGAVLDAAIYYDANDLVIDTQVVGTGNLRLKSGSTPITTDPYVRHVQIQAALTGIPAAQPASIAIGTASAIQFASSGLSKYAYCQWEVPSDWAGDDVVIEIDWCPDSGAMTAPDAVKWDVEYRAVAEGDSITGGTVATGTVTVSITTPQYAFTHSAFTLAFDDANQPLTKQDHVFFKFTRDTTVANDFSGTAAITEYEVVYNSIGIPTSN
jgi:hypothetical protein